MRNSGQLQTISTHWSEICEVVMRKFTMENWYLTFSSPQRHLWKDGYAIVTAHSAKDAAYFFRDKYMPPNSGMGFSRVLSEYTFLYLKSMGEDIGPCHSRDIVRYPDRETNRVRKVLDLQK